MLKRTLVLASLGALLVLAPVALADKGGTGSGKGNDPSINLVMVNDLNGDGLPNWGDTVTFDVTTTASYPAVQLACYQNGALVLNQTAGFFPSYMGSKNFTLESSSWNGGAADCTATLYTTSSNGKQTTLAATSFSVGA